MSAVSPTTWARAGGLLHHGAARREPTALAEALDRVFDRLQRRLVALVGPAGFASLATRALHLARRAHPGLAALEYDARATPCLRGTRDFAATHTAAEVEVALTDVLAQVLGLLDTFIGAELTVRLLDELWPEAGSGAAHDTDTEATA